MILGIAKDLLMAEEKRVEEERAQYMEEKCPSLSLPGSLQELQVYKCLKSLIIMAVFYSVIKCFLHYGQDLCKELHQKIDAVDEERYDLSVKVSKSEKEVLNAWILFILHGIDFQQITLCVFFRLKI